MVTEKREAPKGREAQISNIRAAIGIADAVRSTLGPGGFDKMLYNEALGTLITNDGVSILRDIDIEHPGAEMMADVAKTQEATCKDGTTSVVVLAGQLLQVSEILLTRGVHPSDIIRAYQEAGRLTLSDLNGDHWLTGIDVVDIAKTALRGKAAETDLDLVAALCVEAAEKAGGNLDRIRVVTQTGGSLSDSAVHPGIILNKAFSSDGTPKNVDGPVLLLNGGLEGFDYSQVQMQVNDVQQMHAIQQQEHEILSEAAAMVAGSSEGGCVFVRDRVHESVSHYLQQQGIPLVTSLQTSDMEALSRLTGAPIYHRPEDVKETPPSAVIEECNIGDLRYVTVDGEGEAVTLLIRGATRQTLDEFERAFDDAVGVTCLYMNDPRAVPGGGAAYSHLGRLVRKKAQDSRGLSARERMAIEAFADGLEVIPATIASNAGMDALDVVMELRSISDPRKGLYINGATRGIEDMVDVGVIEPLALVEQVISSAVEVTLAILRIDDIIGRRTE
tara:strand:+ start:291 stop:1799 length:1509 start_codon:yes stop_codon:yes gene_type:complete